MLDMQKRRSFTLAVVGLIVASSTVLFLFFTTKLTSLDPTEESSTVWIAPTLDEIYEHFGPIEDNVQNFIWPTNITRTMTSSFAEFRSTHFHAGIDISTLGRIGAPVFASKTGYIERVRVSPFGYGKYIVMRHEDGYSTLYAHLDSFDEKIEARVDAVQQKRGTYSVTVHFDPGEMIYEQGATIARSGSTGSGPPHIHFEIRDTNYNPINPKYSKPIAINDNTPPIFNRIAFIPITENAYVNEAIKPTAYGVTNVGRGIFELRRSLTLSGTVGLAVDVIDRNDDTWQRHGIYGLQLFINDSLVFAMTYDRIPGAHSQQVRYHYDNDLLREGRGRYQKLFIENGNVLPMYHRMPHGSGLINTDLMDEGEYAFRIVAFDFAGNLSTLQGTFALRHRENRTPFNISNPYDRFKSGKENDLIDVSSELYRDILIVHIRLRESNQIAPELFIGNAGQHFSVPVERLTDSVYRGRMKLSYSSDPNWRIHTITGELYTEIDYFVYGIHPDKRGSFRAPGDLFSIAYDYGSVYNPLYLTIRKIDNGRERFYNIYPSGSVLSEGITITLSVPEEIEPFDRTVLYSREGSRWSTLSTNRNRESRTISARLRRLAEDITVAVDTTSPTIENVIVEGNRNLRLRFRLNDNESGIDHSSLKIHLNDKLLIGRYDPDHSMVVYRSREPFTPGEYTLSITVRDRAGNGTEYGRTVVIR
jgi:murein DD-endopeptidase MepM/ murein hydrolase activator NlpD